jgi:hypothetical protein
MIAAFECWGSPSSTYLENQTVEVQPDDESARSIPKNAGRNGRYKTVLPQSRLVL